MSLFGVSPTKEKQLLERMARLKVSEDDLEEKFIRSGGKGGQNVNKVSTRVYLKHIPSGISVKCQKERYQGLNRFLARRMLLDKLEENLLKGKSEQQQKIEKIRRQKHKRSKRAKEKVLKLKKLQSEKKNERSFIKKFDYDKC